MTDYYDESGESSATIETTPNLSLQINKFDEDEYLYGKYVPEKALFADKDVISNIKNFYNNNVDIPIIVYGAPGIGKLTCVLGLLQHLSCYLNSFPLNKKINNIKYFKILDSEYNKILFYENIFYLNIEILNNNNEIIDYLKYIYQIAKSNNITNYNNSHDNCNSNSNSNSTETLDDLSDFFGSNKKSNAESRNGESSNGEPSNGESSNADSNSIPDKKIIIIKNIDKCNKEAQLYIAFMIDKINTNISYIFTTHNTNTINSKITSSCTKINFKYLDETTFTSIFKTNFKSIYEKDSIILTQSILKQFYQIYIANKYNIGNTISQIKYYLATEGISFLNKNENTLSLLSTIAANFIKKKLVLTTLSSALEIRKFLYIMLSLNMKLIIFVKEVVRQLNNSKLNTNIKIKIIEKSSILSKELLDSNKEIIIIETFFYDIINIIYSNVSNK